MILWKDFVVIAFMFMSIVLVSLTSVFCLIKGMRKDINRLTRKERLRRE